MCAPLITRLTGNTGRECTPCRVLIVEDETSVRAMLTEWLNDSGFVVETAGEGEEALGRFCTALFDVVIADRSMPNVNGDQLAHIIKRVQPQTTVIAVSALAAEGRAPGVHGVADHVLSKPFPLSELGRIMADIRGKKTSRCLPSSSDYQV